MSTRNYEAMFILDHSAATEDFDGTAAIVDQLLEKHGATVVQKEKWDERKLAYEIKGHRRGTYYLTYFTAEPTAIEHINEDVELAERILRHMVIVLDRPIDEHIQVQAEEREKMAEDSRKNSLGGWGGGRRGSDRGGRSGPPRRRDEGSRDEGPRGDGPRGDGPRGDGPRGDGPKDKGAGGDDKKAPAEPAVAAASSDGSDDGDKTE